jgi:hypothetical protein
VGRYGWKGGKGVGAEKGSTSLIRSKRGKERKKTSGRFRAQPAVDFWQKKNLTLRGLRIYKKT